MAVTDHMLRQRILLKCEARGPNKSCCPSDIARSFGDDWRALMPRVRAQACELAAVGQIVISQRGQTVDAATARGPIRLAMPRRG